MPQQQAMTGAVEEYLEAIHRLSGAGEASTTRLADHLGVKPASVTGMLKRLAGLGLITYRRYGRMGLTPEGQRRAREVIRRHRLAERLLTDLLGMPLEQVHDEACRLEHAVSPAVESRIAERLGDPDACPHGNPIRLTPRDRALPLSEAPVGRPLTVVRLEDESAEVVRYLSERNLLPNASVIVQRREPLSGALVLEVNGDSQTLGREVAATIRVAGARRRGRR